MKLFKKKIPYKVVSPAYELSKNMVNAIRNSLWPHQAQPLKSKIILAIAAGAAETLYYQGTNKLDQWISKKYSSTPHQIETPLIKELREVYEAIDNSPMVLSVAYLLYGPPGTGKSFLPQLLGGRVERLRFEDFERKDPLVSEAVPSHYSMQKSSIYVIDEIDKWILDDPKTEQRILGWLDQARQEKCMIFLTTNNPDAVPAALKRKGRLTDTIEVPPWTNKEVKDFCEKYNLDLAQAPSHKVGDLVEWARQEYLKKILEKAK